MLERTLPEDKTTAAPINAPSPDTTFSTDPKLLAGIHQRSRLLDDTDWQLPGTATSSCHKTVYKYCLRASALSLN